MDDIDTVLLIQRRFHTNQQPVVKTLLDRGHDVRFLSLSRDQTETYESLRPDMLRYSGLFLLLDALLGPLVGESFTHRYGFPNPLWYYRYLRKVDPDVVIVKKYFVVSFVSVLYARAMGLDLMFYDQRPVHGDETVYWKRKILAVWHFVLFWKPFVRISPVLGDESAPLARPRSYYVPFVAPTWRSPHERSYFDGGSINVIMVGKLYSERKNHLLLLEAVDELHTEYDLTLTIVGSLDDETNPHYQRVCEYVEDNDMGDIVTLERNMAYERLQESYRDHDVYVLPSRNEPAAVSHLEAMTQGLAIVCSDSNGTRQYVDEGTNGYLCSCDDSPSLRTTLERLVSSRETIRLFGAESLRLARMEYSPEKFYERFSQVVDENFNS